MSKSGTRSANRMGSIRRRSDGRWEGRYTDPSGRQRSVYAKTQKDAAAALRAATAQVDGGGWMEPSRMTVGEWMNIWLSDYQAHTTGHTVEIYRAVTDNHILPVLKDVRLTVLNSAHIRRMITQMTEKDSSPSTIKLVRGVLQAALNCAIEAKLIRDNPVRTAKAPKQIRHDFTIIDREHISSFIDAARQTRFADAYILLLLTGLRCGELRGLRWSDIDFDARTLRVDRQLYEPAKGGEASMKPPKNGEIRTVYLTQQAVDLLKAHRRKQLTQRMAAGWIDTDLTRDLVIRNPNGSYVRVSQLHYALNKIRASMSLPNLRLHDLRHSYAVAALRAGIDVKTVQHNLGHKLAGITLDTYAAYTDDAGKVGAEKLATYLSDAIN